MKRILAIISILGLVLSCNRPEDGENVERLNEQAANCTMLNTTISSLQSIIAALENGQELASFAPVADAAGKAAGYLFTFDSGSKAVYNAPAYVTVGQKDGKYCWMANGEYLADMAGKNAPRFKVEGEVVKISVDGGSTWAEVAEESRQMISSVTENAGSVEIAMDGGAKITVPKAAKLQVELIAENKSYTPNQSEYVQYRISGAEDRAISVEVYASNGWKADLFKITDTEGYVKVVAPADASKTSVMLFVSTDNGETLATSLDLSSASQAPDSPVLSALVDVVNIGCDGGDIEVKVSTNLDYEVITDADWVVYKQTKAVREDVVVLEVAKNNTEDARAALITFKSGTFYTSCEVMQEANYGEIDNEPQTPVDPDLSKNGTANCYIVNAEGTYSFDATVIGNGVDGIMERGRFHVDEDEIELEPVKAELLWSQNECVKDVRLDKSTGVITFTATGSKGNALIAVYDDYDDIAWSWHIWCTNMPKDVAVHNVRGKEFILQDRNIGATSINPNEVEKTHGLFYQWGRKDPFIPSKELKSTMVKNPTNGIDGAVMNPTVPFKILTATGEWFNGVLSKVDHYLWGNGDYQAVHPLSEYSKSIYDPCPVGYMVPPQDTWEGLTENDLQFVPAGFFQLLDGGKKLYYPYAGWCDQGNNDNLDCGYSGYYRYVAEGTRERVWLCRLWTSATGFYVSNYMGGTQMMVQHDPIYGGYTVAGVTGDMRGRLIPVRCVKMQ